MTIDENLMVVKSSNDPLVILLSFMVDSTKQLVQSWLGGKLL